jgi:hypothetical protein
MKQPALEPFGHCLSLVGLTAKLPTAEEGTHTRQSSPDVHPVHRCEADCDRRGFAVSLVHIGVVALDCRPLQAGADGPNAFDGRRPPGPARVIASVG